MKICLNQVELNALLNIKKRELIDFTIIESDKSQIDCYLCEIPEESISSFIKLSLTLVNQKVIKDQETEELLNEIFK